MVGLLTGKRFEVDDVTRLLKPRWQARTDVHRASPAVASFIVVAGRVSAATN
ncbi:hypothetical protein [Methylobacterium sp. R2-1]|uniref:hypothetical protein n=1 Tax=Methylobacterium sp. R2-1 TaxID=2587064 RepID=UPI00161E7B24|nr:hypothetical protein [Methylobacterium sp. R2-1]MBB2962526.1 hypothetical protein [Methylobacterium sp. R2-1]